MGIRDRLAVWTYEMAGEVIPAGDPSVSDAERAAAGRETIAERWRALLPANRDRAAARYAEAGLPDGVDMERVWQPRDPAELRERLGDQPVAAWAQGDVLHVLWRGHAEQVQLGGGVQPRLWPVAGADDLWEASLRIRRLDEAVISVVVAPHAPGQQGPVRMTGRLIWRGPRAPAARPAAERLRGAIEEHSLDSAALCAARRVTVYRPPGRAVAGCVLADGEAAHGFARVLEPAIDDGSVPPVLLVGVHTGTDPGGLRPGRPDRRAQEYLPGHHRQRFAAHLRFVADEVVPWAARRFGPVPGTWAAAGFSNGAAWAIAAAQRRPEVFGAVAALSAGVVPKRISGQSRSVPVRHYLAAGTLEPGFRRATRDWAERLRRAGLPCRHEEWIGGHDHLWWEQQFPAALAWLDLKLPGPADKTRAMSCAAI